MICTNVKHCTIAVRKVLANFQIKPQYGSMQRYLNYKGGYSRFLANTGAAWNTGFSPWKTGFSQQVMSRGR